APGDAMARTGTTGPGIAVAQPEGVWKDRSAPTAVRVPAMTCDRRRSAARPPAPFSVATTLRRKPVSSRLKGA
ncbi:hypothetical protein, partial [Streptomyces sp. 8L]|uniref:hypothetical protein n=1 Tax=Streptomyces sp. 8L TaxID=2877242 RepID=UPI001CD486AC